MGFRRTSTWTWTTTPWPTSKLFGPPAGAVGLIAASIVACASPAVAPKVGAMAARPVLAPAAPAPSPPLVLLPADVARIGLVATFVAPALQRSLDSGVALARQAAPLPLDAAGVRDMLLAQAGLPPEVARHLDLGAPIAGAAVAAGPGRSPLSAFSFGGKSAADVAALVDALGRVIARRGSAVELETRTGDQGWFLPMGTIVVFADTEEALVRAGSLAIEARRASTDDLSVVTYPDALARAVGTDVKTAVRHYLGEMEERAAAGGSSVGPEASRQLRDLANYVEDVATAEFALGLDPNRGATVSMRLNPKAGSRLEAVARFTKASPREPLLLGAAPSADDKAGGVAATAHQPAKPNAAADEAGLVIASAYGGRTLDQIRRQRAKLSGNSAKDARGAGQLLDALAEGLTGELSMTGRVEPGLSGELVYPARDAAAGARIQAALLAGDKAVWATLFRTATQGEGVDVKVSTARPETVGKIRALHTTLALTVRGDTKGLWRKVVGPSGLDAFAAVIGGDKLVVTTGKGAKARMAAFASGKGGKVAPSAALARALAESAGRSFFYFFDLRQIVSFAVKFGGDPRLQMLGPAASRPMPILGGAAGDGAGRLFTLDLTIPPSCFAGIGGLVQAAMLTRN